MASDAGSAELSDESASAADERAYEWWKSIKQIAVSIVRMRYRRE